jgi:hypothetical protein
MIETTFIISVCSGILFTISEILPYLSKIKSNGILQFIIEELIRTKQSNKTNQQDDKYDQIIDLLEDIKSNQNQKYSLDTKSQITSQ